MACFVGSYDVAVVGAGPVGSVAAIAFARRGARVALLEANAKARHRFAGEWIHPSGVAVLDRLRAGRFEGAAPRTGYGFNIVAEDGAIEMPYPTGTALSAEHAALVEGLRETATRLPGVDYFGNARVTAIDGRRVAAHDKIDERDMELEAARIVGADGRASVTRRTLALDDSSELVSYMAAVELHDAELPLEGYGHVVLGGPGPALLYRIGQDRIRGCLDVPVELGGRARTPEFLRSAFEPVLPAGLVRAFRDALTRAPLAWAANRFRPRVDFGRDRIALVGDAVGHVHPMTAIGLSMGFLDALALAELDDVGRYARARSGHVPELLAGALYQCFRRSDPSARALRQAILDALRKSRLEREHTMRILACQDDSVVSFAGVCARMIGGALKQTFADHPRGDRSGALTALAAYGEWAKWPGAAVLPKKIRAERRARSTVSDPMPSRRGAAPRRVMGSALEPSGAVGPRDTRAVASIAEAIGHGTELLLRELEALAMQYGRVPDEALAAPGMHMMRAVTSTEMRAGIAARMTIGRRRLAMEGIPRLIGLERGRASRPFAVADLADLLLVLVGGSAWAASPIAGLDAGVHALLEAQTAGGAFRLRAFTEPPAEDVATTAVACRALRALLASASVEAARAEAALDRAAHWLRASQLDDGSFEATGANDALAKTAWAVEALVAAGAAPNDPALARAARWLLSRQGAGGTRRRDVADPRAARRADARAVRALIAAGFGESAEVARAVERLSEALTTDLPVGQATSELEPWEECWEIVEALGARARQLGAHPVRVQPDRDATRHAEQDWAFCRDSLDGVSRTFSRPIAFLPDRLRIVVTVSYLLCRVADTIEDHPSVPAAARDRMFALFLEVLDGRREPELLAQRFERLPGDDAELLLGRNLPVVGRVLGRQSAADRATCVRWVSEMARGMCLYTHREPATDGVTALYTLGDLERYCYFVAGTVGHLLTDLFLTDLGDAPQRALELRRHAESFGSGLQLVNILKDLTDDRARRWSYVPRTACAAMGLGISELTDPARRAEARAAVAPIFDVARRHLDDGLSYSLAIPPEHKGIRLFCLLPLWMAVRTLAVARASDAMFVPNAPVKIRREEVDALTAECIRLHADDAALRERYAALWLDAALPAQRSAG
jgi:2-polyprenyl-6-methoxyphenol hydroxylase-like FAD-dependent oxidoreductase/phytoene/squalene synthetase